MEYVKVNGPIRQHRIQLTDVGRIHHGNQTGTKPDDTAEKPQGVLLQIDCQCIHIDAQRAKLQRQDLMPHLFMAKQKQPGCIQQLLH